MAAAAAAAAAAAGTTAGHAPAAPLAPSAAMAAASQRQAADFTATRTAPPQTVPLPVVPRQPGAAAEPQEAAPAETVVASAVSRTPSLPLPDGWEAKKSDTNEVFFIDHNRQATQWRSPWVVRCPVLIAPAGPTCLPAKLHLGPVDRDEQTSRCSQAAILSLFAQVPAGWDMAVCPEGRLYYVDTRTGETQRQPPSTTQSPPPSQTAALGQHHDGAHDCHPATSSSAASREPMVPTYGSQWKPSATTRPCAAATSCPPSPVYPEAASALPWVPSEPHSSSSMPASDVDPSQLHPLHRHVYQQQRTMLHDAPPVSASSSRVRRRSLEDDHYHTPGHCAPSMQSRASLAQATSQASRSFASSHGHPSSTPVDPDRDQGLLSDSALLELPSPSLPAAFRRVTGSRTAVAHNPASHISSPLPHLQSHASNDDGLAPLEDSETQRLLSFHFLSPFRPQRRASGSTSRQLESFERAPAMHDIPGVSGHGHATSDVNRDALRATTDHPDQQTSEQPHDRRATRAAHASPSPSFGHASCVPFSPLRQLVQAYDDMTSNAGGGYGAQLFGASPSPLRGVPPATVQGHVLPRVLW